MAIFELVIALLFAGAMLSAWARRVHAPYPALLALAGAALTFVPHVPSVRLDPQLALALFVAPVLLNAAFDSSPRDLWRDWRAVTSLALVAVGLTVIAVALTVRALVPGMPWSVAVALGAIVAPPDAAAASAVLRQLRLPHRVLVIVEGESLFNDAGALLVYRFAVVTAMSGHFAGWSAVPALALVAAGSVALGAVLAPFLPRILLRMNDAPTSVVVQFVTTFAVWIAAERLHLSAIITVVVFAILVARRSPAQMPARLRIPSYAVWDFAVFVLNVLAFILTGSQIKPILERLDRAQVGSYFATALAVCAAVIVVRIVWVMGYSLVARWLLGRHGDVRDVRGPASPKGAAVVAWCGMRGIVTLATALALPEEFPHRGLVVLCAYSVVLVTLVVQGFTLTPLLNVLGLEEDGSVEDEVALARARIARAALGALDGVAREAEGDLLALLRRKLELRASHAERRAGPAQGTAGPEAEGECAAESAGIEAYNEAMRKAYEAERLTLFELRRSGVIGDDAFHRVEEELDWAEVNAETMARAD
jgi:monovalent cation/hydrogen antiporter